MRRCRRTGSRSAAIRRASARRVGRAAHVLLHDAHAGCWLEIESAAVEADALADDRDARVAGFAPFELDEARRALGRGGRADGGDQRIFVRQLLARGDPDVRARAAGFLAHCLLELGWAEVGGGRVDQVTDERGGFGEANRLVDARRFAGDEHAGAAVRLRLRAVGVEPVLSEQPAERRLAGLARWRACRCLRAAARRVWRGTRARASQRWQPRSPPRNRRHAAAGRTRSAFFPSKR